MKEIVQLTREEYESLAEKAGHNEKEILRQARKLYEENGICGIILDIECECDVSDRYSFKVSSYVREGKTGYSISYEDRRRLQEFVDSHATEMMTRKFGRQIEDINHWNTLARRMELVPRTGRDNFNKVRIWNRLCYNGLKRVMCQTLMRQERKDGRTAPMSGRPYITAKMRYMQILMRQRRF